MCSCSVMQHRPFCGMFHPGSSILLAARQECNSQQMPMLGQYQHSAVAGQVLVDCVKANGSNGCSGGDPTAAYSYILEHGIPDETCSNYEVQLHTGSKRQQR